MSEANAALASGRGGGTCARLDNQAKPTNHPTNQITNQMANQQQPANQASNQVTNCTNRTSRTNRTEQATKQPSNLEAKPTKPPTQPTTFQPNMLVAFSPQSRLPYSMSASDEAISKAMVKTLRYEAETLGEEPAFAKLHPSATRWCYIGNLCRVLKLDPFCVIRVAHDSWSKSANAPYVEVVGISGHWCIRAAHTVQGASTARDAGASTARDAGQGEKPLPSKAQDDADRYNVINKIEEAVDDGGEHNVNINIEKGSRRCRRPRRRRRRPRAEGRRRRRRAQRQHREGSRRCRRPRQQDRQA